MEVTAAAAQAATYTSNKSLAEQINDYLATTKTSIATLASEIPGYSRPTISRYLSGKYEGDIAAIEKLLADWLAGRTGEDVALPEPGRKTGTKPAFFESRDALKVLGVCITSLVFPGVAAIWSPVPVKRQAAYSGTFSASFARYAKYAGNSWMTSSPSRPRAVSLSKGRPSLSLRDTAPSRENPRR